MTMMSSAQNFTEWTREQKEEYAKKRMTEMKLKNEKLMRRYAEVEQDRIAAEEHNSAITNSSKVVSKKENSNELVKTENKIEHTREWDRGKPDKEHWKSPEHHSSYINYRTSHFEKKSNRRNNWRNYSRNENRDQYRYDYASDNIQGRKMKGNYAYKHHESDQPHVANSFHQSPKKTRGVENQNNELQWKSRQFYTEKYKTPDYKVSNPKRHSDRGRSYGVNDVDYLDNIALRASLWENDKISEDQNKQNRVETWVKSVNKSNLWGGKKFSPIENSKTSAASGGDVYSCDEYPKNSQRETELQKNNNHNLSKVDSYEIKQYSQERSDRSDPININQCNKKFYKNTHNSEYSSSGNNRKEHFRRQKFDNKCMRNGRERFNKSKVGEKSSSFNDDQIDPEDSRMRIRNKSDSTLHSYKNDGDTWGISSQNVSTITITSDDDLVDPEDSRMERRKHGPSDSTLHSYKNDTDTWGISSQNVSTITITSDDDLIDPEDSRMGRRKHGSSGSKPYSYTNDTDTWGISSQNMSTITITSDDTWGDTTVSFHNDDKWGSTTVSNQNEDTWGSSTVSIQNDDDGVWGNVAVRNRNNDDDGVWSNVDQSHIQWKLSDDEIDSPENRIHKQKKFVNKNMAQSDGWENKKSSNDAITNMLKKNKKSNEDSGFNSNVKIKENISLSNLKSHVNKTAAIQKAKHNTTKKNFNLPEKNQNDSDDGGWSTVSEEDEIH